MELISLAWSWLTGGSNKLAIYLGAALVLAVLLGWLFWSRASLKGDLAQAEANVTTLQGANRAKAKAIEDLQRTAKTVDAAMVQREHDIQAITAQREALRAKLVEVLANDPQSRAWADQPVPSAVRGLLR